MLHSQILPSDNHPFYKWSYASASARLQEPSTSFDVVDCGKVAWDADTNTFWILTSTRPITWAAIGTAPAPGSVANTANSIVVRDGSGNFSAGTIAATFNGTLVGNADTATQLKNSPSIALSGSVSGTAVFAGNANIVITVAPVNGQIVLGTHTTGNYTGAVAVSGNGLTIANTSAVGGTYTVTSNATANSVPNTIVYRDSNNNFAANEITANKFIGPISGTVVGNSDTASKWATARTITVTGSNSGSVSLDGSANVTLTLNPAANGITLGTDTTGDYVATAAVVSNTGLTSTGGTGEGSTFSIGTNATAAATPGTLVMRDNSGNFVANEITATKFIGPITGTITGNAESASKLLTKRTITLAGDVSGSALFDGGTDITINTTATVPMIILGTGTFGDYVANIGQGTGVTVSGGTGAGSSPTISIGQDVAPTATPTFAGITLTGDSMSTGNFVTSRDIGASGITANSLALSASSAAGAPLHIAPGIAPILAVDGDIWTTSAGVFSQVGGTTVQLSTTSQLGNYVLKAGDTMTGGLTINGALSATTKNFLISHPTKPGYTLRYGSLEGPENGVYIRGKTTSSVIELPEYWTKLVDPASITVSLTAIGCPQDLMVAGVWDNKVFIINSTDAGAIDCYYHIFAERRDVEKLQTEALDRRV